MKRDMHKTDKTVCITMHTLQVYLYFINVNFIVFLAVDMKFTFSERHLCIELLLKQNNVIIKDM